MKQDDYVAPSPGTASRKLACAVTPLNRAGRQLDRAIQTAPDRFHRERIHSLVDGLRNSASRCPALPADSERGVSNAGRQGTAITAIVRQIHRWDRGFTALCSKRVRWREHFCSAVELTEATLGELNLTGAQIRISV